MSRDEEFLELRKFLAPEYVFGSGAAWLAGRYASNLGARRVMLVSDPGVDEAGWTTRVEETLAESGITPVTFLGVTPNPRESEVMRGAAVYMDEGCDAIVVVGGGSPIDCAKGIGIVAATGRHILDFEGEDKVDRPCPPLICIPTTAGTSADVSQFAIISDTARKMKVAIVSKSTVPDVSLVDPVLTTTMSRDLTVDTGLDALTHAIEAYVSNAASPMTDLHAIEAVRLIAKYLPKVADDLTNIPLRGKMMLGSLFAGLAFSNAILGAVHAMAHSLGGFLDLPHGRCNAILLDHVMAFNFEAAPKRYTAIGRAMGAEIPESASQDEARERMVAAIRALKAAVGATETLGSLGVRAEDLPALAAKAAADPCLLTNPRAMGEKELAEIYDKAL